jgi:hypothetical protein
MEGLELSLGDETVVDQRRGELLREKLPLRKPFLRVGANLDRLREALSSEYPAAVPSSARTTPPKGRGLQPLA